MTIRISAPCKRRIERVLALYRRCVGGVLAALFIACVLQVRTHHAMI
jgi:hypothetical protein